MVINEQAQVSNHAYVEDVPEHYDNAVALVSAPPRAPSPPPSAPPVNVFDFLVNDETPNASRVSLSAPSEQMQMVAHAPPIFKSSTNSPHDTEREPEWEEEEEDEEELEEQEHVDYEYSTKPVPTKEREMFRTPAQKIVTYEAEGKSLSTDKKRKRQVEDLDLTQARRSSQELDEEMPDVGEQGRPLLHTGLTGGLNRLMNTSKFPPSPEYSAGSGPEPSPLSPAKRKRAALGGATVERRGRAANGQLVKVRKVRRSSDESRPRKHHRSHTHREQEDPERSRRPMKTIEYHRTTSPNASDANQLIVYQHRAEMFLSFVTKGPESESGYSLNKALKRYHRERGEHGLGKQEEEKELFKSLRLKRNERGEVVLMVGQDK